MGFNPFTWLDSPITSTPRSAAALIAQEQRGIDNLTAMRTAISCEADPFVANQSIVSYPRLVGYYETDFGGSKGFIEVGAFVAPYDLLASNISMASGDQAAVGNTLVKMGLWTVAADDALTLVAETANDTSIFSATSTLYSRDFTTPYQMTAGVRYAAGALWVGATTEPHIMGLVTDGPGFSLDRVPGIYNVGGGWSDLTDLGAGSASANTFIPYVILEV